ncbi:MAG TPA: hypothetical protein VK841_19275 [Polyangiaceae bacterium]|jgi:hypothetical protein|nr:hypothetical protein [Polyangiaceae bacterium]
MTLDEIDQRLLAWDECLRRIDENLIALEGDPTYQVLTSPARTTLEGRTAERVTAALDAVQQLFEAREKLTNVLGEARAIRESLSTLSFWGTDEKVAQIVTLLTTPSIHVGAQVVPLARRNLLDKTSRDVAVDPEALVRTMTEAFERARDAIVDVGTAWNQLDPVIGGLEAEMVRLSAAARELGEGAARAELAPMQRELAYARERVAKDPLGALGDIESLQPRLFALRDRIGAQASLRQRAAGVLARAGELRAELADAHRAARLAETVAPHEFEPAPLLGSPLAEEAIGGLDEWRATLEQTMHAGHFGPAEIGGGRLVAAIEGALAHDRAVAAGYEALVRRRNELEGRLSARRAQATVLIARGGRIPPHAMAAAQEVSDLLARRPTPVDRAAHRLEAFEQAIAAAGRTS